MSFVSSSKSFVPHRIIRGLIWFPEQVEDKFEVSRKYNQIRPRMSLSRIGIAAHEHVPNGAGSRMTDFIV